VVCAAGTYWNPGYGALTVNSTAATYNSVTCNLANSASPSVLLCYPVGMYYLLFGGEPVGLVYSADGSTVTVPGFEPDMPPVFTKQ
jgi:hypothetical protein